MLLYYGFVKKYFLQTSCRYISNNSNTYLNLFRIKINNKIKMSSVKDETTTNHVEYLDTPVKSQSDKKNYRVIRLENGLTALLISDSAKNNDKNEIEIPPPDCDSSSEESEEDCPACCSTDDQSSDDENKECRNKSAVNISNNEKFAAVGLCISVGNFSDPWEIQGMAHFLEHMVFMGSEKFPEENDFDSFIKKRGGSDNASTDAEHTTFHFECREKYLKGAIIKFSQFFISPLMKREAMTREREAIESEFQMAVPSDDNRITQFRSSLAHPDNPVRKFSWGNLKTLKEGISDDELYKTVHEFRKRHYSSHRMTLAVQAQIPLDLLELWISEYFKGIPNNHLPAEDFQKFADSAFNTPEFHKMYWVEPVSALCQVELTWALPPTKSVYHSKPHRYLASIIGHEGRGSLLAYLRNLSWAVDLTAGVEYCGLENNSMFSLFIMNIQLTETGYEHLREVLDAAFGYLKMLQLAGPSEEYFKELQTVQETKFRFADETASDEYVSGLAEAMHFFTPEQYVTGDSLFFKYDPEVIENYTRKLNPESVNIIVSYKECKKEYDKVEPWFQTKYCVSDIPNDWLESWNNIEPDPYFCLPEKNIFITTDFDLLPFPEEAESKYPVKVQENSLCEVWYCRDLKFKLPQAFMYYFVVSPLPFESAKNAVMLDLYTYILHHFMGERMYPASEADLHFSITSCDKGFSLYFYGFNQKLHLVIETALKEMLSLGSKMTEEVVDALRESLRKNYYNSFCKPYSLGRDLHFSLVLQNNWTYVEKHAALSEINLASMQEFSHKFLEHLYIQSLVQGNITKDQAIDACNKMLDTLKCVPLLPNTFPEVRVARIPLGEHKCHVKSFSSQDPNSYVSNYYQTGVHSTRKSCIIGLLMLMMEEPVFDILRTKEQLGYDVDSQAKDTFGILGLTVTVNYKAEKYTAAYIDERIEAFMKKFRLMLKKTTSQELEEFSRNLIKLKQMSDNNLAEEVWRNWGEVISHQYMFDRFDREVAEIRKIKMSDIQKWYSENISGNRSNFRKITIQVSGSADTSEKSDIQKKSNSSSSSRVSSSEKNETAGKFSLHFVDNGVKDVRKVHSITSIGDFKKGLSYYPPRTVGSFTKLD